jgi:hypothetical protein
MKMGKVIIMMKTGSMKVSIMMIRNCMANRLQRTTGDVFWGRHFIFDENEIASRFIGNDKGATCPITTLELLRIS